MDCIFCKIVNNELPSYTIYEDEIVKAFLDIHPDANGHTILIPKKHFVTIEDLDEATLLHLNKVTKELYQVFKTKLNAQGLTLNQNNDLGQEIKHYHLHLVPRYPDDGYHSVCQRETLLNPEEIFTKLKG